MSDKPLKDVPVNFLLTCGEPILADFQLMRLQAVADLRKQLIATIDQMVDELAKAALAAWFRANDKGDGSRAHLKTRKASSNGQTSESAKWPAANKSCCPCLHRTRRQRKAHCIAAATYQKRIIADGKCRVCPNPLAHGSVQYCEEHLAKARTRQRTKKGLSDPGSREYLYTGEIPESTHGRQPGTLASLAMNREKKTRALLAEIGIPPESAAVTLNAAKEALLKVMPEHMGLAMTQAQLSGLAVIPSKTIGNKALNELLAAGLIERTGKGTRGDSYRYCAPKV